MNAKVTIETITPQMARKWLDNRFEGQRKVRENHVHRMAQEIVDGKWMLTPDAFTLIRGKLANGQHRCEAIALAGRDCDALVLRTDDESLFNVMDSGITRKAYDVLAQNGIADGPVLTAAARLVILYKKGLLTPRGENGHKKLEGSKIRKQVTRQDVIDFITDHETEIAVFSETVKKLFNKNPILSKAWAIAFLILADPLYGAAAEKFITSIYKGMDEKTAYLRDRLIKGKSGASKMNRYYTFGVIIKAFRHYLDGTTYSQIRIGDTEEFPTL